MKRRTEINVDDEGDLEGSVCAAGLVILDRAARRDQGGEFESAPVPTRVRNSCGCEVCVREHTPGVLSQ